MLWLIRLGHIAEALLWWNVSPSVVLRYFMNTTRVGYRLANSTAHMTKRRYNNINKN